jgi:hypothetical protein
MNARGAACSRPLAASGPWRGVARAAAALLLLLPLLGNGAAAEEQRPLEAPTPVVEGAPPPVNVAIHYLGKAYDEPVPLSLVDKVLTDNGLQGARLAIKDNNRSGAFLGQNFELIEDIVLSEVATVYVEFLLFIPSGPEAPKDENYPNGPDGQGAAHSTAAKCRSGDRAWLRKSGAELAPARRF